MFRFVGLLLIATSGTSGALPLFQIRDKRLQTQADGSIHMFGEPRSKHLLQAALTSAQTANTRFIVHGSEYIKPKKLDVNSCTHATEVSCNEKSTSCWWDDALSSNNCVSATGGKLFIDGLVTARGFNFWNADTNNDFGTNAKTKINDAITAARVNAITGFNNVDLDIILLQIAPRCGTSVNGQNTIQMPGSNEVDAFGVVYNACRCGLTGITNSQFCTAGQICTITPAGVGTCRNAYCDTITTSSTPTLATTCSGNDGYNGFLIVGNSAIQCAAPTCKLTDAAACCAV